MQIQRIPLWSIDVHKIHIKEWALVKNRLLSIIPWDEINQRKNKFARETLRDEEHEMTWTDYFLQGSDNSDAYDMLYSFLCSELIDWYFEFTKNILRDNKESLETQAVLKGVFLKSLKLLNPAMPFITEELWEKLGEDGLLIDSTWPESIQIPVNASEKIELIKYFVSGIRNFRVDHDIKFSEELERSIIHICNINLILSIKYSIF